jgi:hypothetical protein
MPGDFTLMPNHFLKQAHGSLMSTLIQPCKQARALAPSCYFFNLVGHKPTICSCPSKVLDGNKKAD